MTDLPAMVNTKTYYTDEISNDATVGEPEDTTVMSLTNGWALRTSFSTAAHGGGAFSETSYDVSWVVQTSTTNTLPTNSFVSTWLQPLWAENPSYSTQENIVYICQNEWDGSGSSSASTATR